MRRLKHFIVLIGIFYVQNVSAQSPYFQRIYGTPQEDVGMGVESTPDSGYLVVGFSRGFDGPNHDPLIYKTDKAGNLIWGRRLDFHNSDDIVYACKGLPDGSSLVYGVTKAFLNVAELFLIKFDSSGNTLWLRTFKSPVGKAMWRGVSLDVDAAGLIYLAYCYWVQEPSVANGGVMKLNSDASQVIWSREMANAGNSITNGVMVTNDGSVLLLATYSNSPPGGASCDVAAVLFSSSGDMIWNLVAGGPANEYFFSAMQLSNGHYILGGYVFDVGANRNMLLIDLLPNGAFNWARTVDRANDFGYSAAELPGNRIIMYGTTDGGSINGLWTCVYDFNGNLVSENGQVLSNVVTSGGSALSGYVNGVRVLDNNKIALVGSVQSASGYGGYDNFLTVTNPNSSANCGFIVNAPVVAQDPNFVHVNNLISTNHDSLIITTRTAASIPIRVCVKDICNPTSMVDLQKVGKTISSCQSSVSNLVLDAENDGATYLWNTGQTSRTITVNSFGIYTVRITGPCGFILDTFRIVTANPTKVIATGSPVFCAETPIPVSGQVIPNCGYLWSPGAAVSDSNARATTALFANPSETDTLIKTLVLTAFDLNSPACKSKDTLILKIPPSVPLPILTGDTLLCADATSLVRYQLSGIPGSTFEFSIDPDLDIHLLNNNRYEIAYPTPGTYLIKYSQKTANGCESRVGIQQIHVLDNGSVTIQTNDSVVTRFTLNGNRYWLSTASQNPSWQAPGSRGFANSGDTLVVDWQPGKLERMVLVDASTLKNCHSIDTLRVRYKPILFIPNLITPKIQDGKNDSFMIPDLEFFEPRKLTLFDRWGKKVYHSDSYSGDWTGEDLSPDNYFYLLTAGRDQFTGWVEVSK